MSPRACLYRDALLVWLGLFALAFINGALRELVLAPRLGPTALPLSGMTAMAGFALVIALFVRRARPAIGEAVRVGLLWLALTLAAEALMAVAAGRSVSEVATMFTWQTIAGGNLFALLVAFTALAPALFAWLLRR
jgi:hypothetical protein